jgi:hypothetical protein
LLWESFGSENNRLFNVRTWVWLRKWKRNKFFYAMYTYRIIATWWTSLSRLLRFTREHYFDRENHNKREKTVEFVFAKNHTYTPRFIEQTGTVSCTIKRGLTFKLVTWFAASLSYTSSHHESLGKLMKLNIFKTILYSLLIMCLWFFI